MVECLYYPIWMHTHFNHLKGLLTGWLSCVRVGKTWHTHTQKKKRLKDYVLQRHPGEKVVYLKHLGMLERTHNL